MAFQAISTSKLWIDQRLPPTNWEVSWKDFPAPKITEAALAAGDAGAVDQLRRGEYIWAKWIHRC